MIMEGCSNCFSDLELKAFVSSSSVIGDCSICGTKQSSLLDLNELLSFFQELIDNFNRSPNGDSLKNKLQGNWSLFLNHDVSAKILNYILPKLDTEITSSEDNVDYREDILENIRYWEILKHDLVWNRRYISDISKLEELGWDSYFNTQFELSQTNTLYRARIHHSGGQEPFPAIEMLSPPPKIATGGRANPPGIPYLYLSDDIDTVLYEVRASYLDELSVGVFKLKDGIGPMKIVDFIENTPIFQPNRVNVTIKSRLLRNIISTDLSKPMRRYDTELEYIPTQFICEYIKIFTGASGIRFRSSVHPAGNNFVIFDQSVMECSQVFKRRISRLDLKSVQID